MSSLSSRWALAGSRRRRGAALTETALLMIVLIPLLLYALFLIDAAFMKLDLQETVVSGLWDFSVRNSESGSRDEDFGQIQRAVRATYSDHTSAIDDGAEVNNPGYGEVERIRGNHNHQKHHKIYFAAQYTFRFDANVGPDTQFQCTLSGDSGVTSDPTGLMSAFASSGYNVGGQVRCNATGYIYNYLIPEKLFTEFTDVKMSNLTKRQNNSDSHEFQGRGGNIVAHETGSLIYHTWALRNGAASGRLADADIGARPNAMADPGNVDGPFYDRVTFHYTNSPTYAAVAGASGAFTARAASQRILTAITAGASTRSVTGLPNMAGVFLISRYRAQSPGQRQQSAGFGFGGGQGFQSTPYRNVNNNYVNAASNRGVHYMGCRQEERDRCP
ncbi:MAG TPA: hypothetical protein VFZ09_20250 [Archangium sp.]|uniref:hypothetical protein n=1 Tax=Archangium sp. TaxID=1872627 RepID=UPI002E35FF32|nr:hypothetical protein [Archangium sp.]HEX5748583.1 hypothetical protein [Archangium sp.]